jgi:hypothetical protein
VVVQPVLEDAGDVPEGPVLQQPGVQPVPGVPEEVVELLALLGGQQAGGLELDQGGGHHQEPGRGVEVELLDALTEVGDEVGGDLGQVDLGHVDLPPRDQVQEQVEGPLEDLELDLVGHRAQRSISVGCGTA